MIINTYIPNNDLGLGDFLRGSYWLYRECKKRNIEFEIDFSKHPMKNFLLNENKRDFKIEIVKILVTGIIDFKTIENSLNKILDEYNGEDVYICTNNYFDITKVILDKTILDFLNKRLSLKKELENYLKSIEFSKSLVIHIRLGDNFLKSNLHVLNYKENKIFAQLIFEIANIIKKNSYSKIIIISDNEFSKKKIKSFFRKCTIRNNKPVHLGFCSEKDLENIKETLIDFHIMKEAKHIYKFSLYSHSSGFSNWAALLGNVSYSYIVKVPGMM